MSINHVFEKLASDLTVAEKLELQRWLATVRTHDPDLSQLIIKSPPIGGLVDHGGLTGLGDNDHPQYAVAAKGVTNGDSHNHDGGDGGQIDHTKLATIGTNTHAQIDTYISTDAKYHPLTTPLTSTAWDGDSYSTTAKTLIDLSAVFGVPAGVRAVLVRLLGRDSDSAANLSGCLLMVSPNNTAYVGLGVRVAGITNDAIGENTVICPCDANGDIYYQIAATGAGTLDAWIEIWGYWI
jgi:hypothetical protein